MDHQIHGEKPPAGTARVVEAKISENDQHDISGRSNCPNEHGPCPAVSNGNEEENGQKPGNDEEAADQTIAASVRETFEEAPHSSKLILR
jgi:hypothetical protein